MSGAHNKTADQVTDDIVDGGMLYLKQAMPRLEQILSTLDREPFSKTYGSFDRTWWCWKFTDFSASRFQEGLYPLCYYMTKDLSDNPLYQYMPALEWIRAGFLWWTELQHKNGSFDEAYPYENSFAATAFTCFYLGEAFQRIRQDLPQEDVQKIVRTFDRAGRWFELNDEKHGMLSNHIAAGVAALHQIAQITENSSYIKRADFFLQRIYQKQSEEGWYEEYGGADMGYQSHGMFYLARVWQYTQDSKLLKSLIKASDFFEQVLNPDGTIGGEYTSRNTEFYYPAAFEILSKESASAARTAQYMRQAIAQQAPVGVPSMDAWNLYPVLNNYLFAAENAQDITDVCPPDFLPQDVLYKDAGWYMKRNKTYHAMFGLSKGGVLRVWSREKQEFHLDFSDCGYWVKLNNGKTISSQSFTADAQWNKEGNTVTVTAPFVHVNQKVMRPFLFMCFRLFSTVMGRVPALAYWLKRLLVKALVTKRTETDMVLKRCVTFHDDYIEIEDTLSHNGTIDILDMGRGARFSTIHMGSSRYFQRNEFHLQDLSFKNNTMISDLSQGKPVELRQKWQRNQQKKT